MIGALIFGGVVLSPVAAVIYLVRSADIHDAKMALNGHQARPICPDPESCPACQREVDEYYREWCRTVGKPNANPTAAHCDQNTRTT